MRSMAESSVVFPTRCNVQLTKLVSAGIKRWPPKTVGVGRASEFELWELHAVVYSHIQENAAEQ